MQHGPNCGGEPKIIAAIEQQPVIEKMLSHLDLEIRSRRTDSRIATSDRD
jgi:hypothetical protein